MSIWHGDCAKTALPDRGSVTVQLWHIDNEVLALFGKYETATLEKGKRFSCNEMWTVNKKDLLFALLKIKTKTSSIHL